MLTNNEPRTKLGYDTLIGELLPALKKGLPTPFNLFKSDKNVKLYSEFLIFRLKEKKKSKLVQEATAISLFSHFSIHSNYFLRKNTFTPTLYSAPQL